MTDRELMQEALYALTYVGDAKEIYSDTIESLRARLAQPEQEHSEQWWRHEVSNAYANGYEKGRASVKQPDLITPADVEQLARIEKLVDKIDPYGAQPEQEPVAWADKYDIERDGHDFWVSRQQPAKNGVPLYTAPPQRKWQGLTAEEMREAAQVMDVEPLVEGWKELIKFASAIEAKLKEKNTCR